MIGAAICDFFGRKEGDFSSLAPLPTSKQQLEEELKVWRNTLRQIANIVAHMMKTSSLFVNLVTSVTKAVMPFWLALSPGDKDLNKEKISNIMKKATRFSEAIFERHRHLVKLVNGALGKGQFDAQAVGDFALGVSDFSKQELASQSSFVSSVLEDLPKK